MDSRAAAKEPFIPLMRELVRTYQAFAAFDAAGIRDAGLTVPQADVIFTLGNTDGLTFGEIGEKTLITKGTLTGVVDRLEEKDLVTRYDCPQDGRCTRVRLTRSGRREFEKAFPKQIALLKSRFDRLSRAEQKQTREALEKLRNVF